MPHPDEDRIKELLDEALRRPTPERAAFLDGACGKDRELRAELDGLIAALDKHENLLVAPTGGAKALLDTKLDETRGNMIGRYKLLQQIGVGGFCVVWMAEQREPIVRKVALKIIKLGMDTKQVVARFEAEQLDPSCLLTL